MSRLPFDGSYPITQRFGERPGYYRPLGFPGHEGVDFGLPEGTPVLAPADGECVEVGDGSGAYGFYVKLRTPDGQDWLMAHLQRYRLPRPGEWCPEGSLVGYSNNTGRTSGPHLHLGHRPNYRLRHGDYDGWADPLASLPTPD